VLRHDRHCRRRAHGSPADALGAAGGGLPGHVRRLVQRHHARPLPPRHGARSGDQPAPGGQPDGDDLRRLGSRFADGGRGVGPVGAPAVPRRRSGGARGVHGGRSGFTDLLRRRRLGDARGRLRRRLHRRAHGGSLGPRGRPPARPGARLGDGGAVAHLAGGRAARRLDRRLCGLARCESRRGGGGAGGRARAVRDDPAAGRWAARGWRGGPQLPRRFVGPCGAAARHGRGRARLLRPHRRLLRHFPASDLRPVARRGGDPARGVRAGQHWGNGRGRATRRPPAQPAYHLRWRDVRFGRRRPRPVRLDGGRSRRIRGARVRLRVRQRDRPAEPDGGARQRAGRGPRHGAGPERHLGERRLARGGGPGRLDDGAPRLRRVRPAGRGRGGAGRRARAGRATV
ncbi:MAG: hypothetical protein AVDCRST_MAG08-2123, partial [uncultured Acetobacteraceae bacterium]